PVAKGTFVFAHPDRCVMDVSHPMDKLSIEIRGSAGDTLLGQTVVNADSLRRTSQQFAYPVFREQHGGPSGTVVLSSDFMPTNPSAGGGSGDGGAAHNRGYSSASSLPDTSSAASGY